MSKSLAEAQELSERVPEIYARNCNIRRDDDWYVLKLQEEVGELVSVHLRVTGRGRSKGDDEAAMKQQFQDELADCLAQVFLIAKKFDIDLEAALASKWFKYLDD
ncbi:MAG: phosphoribosyl-ATP pyrophosphohydrolase [Pseudomonadota bacterium]